MDVGKEIQLLWVDTQSCNWPNWSIMLCIFSLRSLHTRVNILEIWNINPTHQGGEEPNNSFWKTIVTAAH